MANSLYDHGRNEFALGNIDWVSDTIGCALVDTASYSVNLATDQDVADVGEANLIASGSLQSKTATGGVCDAANITFSSVAGDSVEAIIIYKDVGTAANNTLIAYIDTASAGLPVTPNGGDITISWSDTENRIFKL
jgi:hypothetical protein